jgi:opacity protein-like surface antigen
MSRHSELFVPAPHVHEGEGRMKRMRLLVVVLASSIALSLAATSSHAEMQIGAIGGLNIANLSIDGSNSLNVRTTFAIGGVVDFGITERFGIRAEPMFVSKGTKAQERNAYWSTVDEAVFELDYIELPVLARYDLATTPTRGYLVGGIAIAMSTGAQVALTRNTVTEKIDFEDVFASSDVSAQLGAGVSFAVGANRMGIDGRVAFGLVDINEGGTVTFDGAPLDVPGTSTRTLDFRLLATYLFRWPGSN